LWNANSDQIFSILGRILCLNKNELISKKNLGFATGAIHGFARSRFYKGWFGHLFSAFKRIVFIAFLIVAYLKFHQPSESQYYNPTS